MPTRPTTLAAGKYASADWTRPNAALAAAFGSTPKAVSASRARYGAPALRHGKPRLLSPARSAAAATAWLAGGTFAALAPRFGVSVNTARRAIRRHLGDGAYAAEWRRRARARRVARLDAQPRRRKAGAEALAVEAARRPGPEPAAGAAPPETPRERGRRAAEAFARALDEAA